jgi:hypothetical protein
VVLASSHEQRHQLVRELAVLRSLALRHLPAVERVRMVPRVAIMQARAGRLLLGQVGVSVSRGHHLVLRQLEARQVHRVPL